jgi:hypothetical protein
MTLARVGIPLRPGQLFVVCKYLHANLKPKQILLSEEGGRAGPVNQDTAVSYTQPYPMPTQTTGQTHP